jgi:F-type H+-transporting ATPase subunit delta
MKSTTSRTYEPYAQALLSLGQSNNLIDDFNNDAGLILETLSGSDELKVFFANPAISEETKRAVVDQVFGGKVNGTMQNFIKLLVDRQRADCLDGICQEFQAQVRKLKGAVLAQVTSTVPLNDAQLQGVRDRVASMTGAQQVQVETSIDPELLGGVIIKVGSQVIDASLKNQLRQISFKLAGVT